MSLERDIDLIDDLRRMAAETPWVEFKRNYADPDMIGERCSALSNACRLEGQDGALFLGSLFVDNRTVGQANYL